MGNLAQLKGTMLMTIIITLIIFFGFIAVVSFFFSYATDLQLDSGSILVGALFLALMFMLIQFAISPSIVRWSTRLRYLNGGENPWLETTVSKLASQAGVNMPRLAIVPDRTPNAFVFGNSSNNMTLAVHQGLLDQLNEDEIHGVLAHELGHIRHKDSIIMTFMSAIPLVTYTVVRMAFGFGYYGGYDGGRKGERDSGAFILLAWFVALVVYFIAQLLVLRLSRLRESYADAFSGYLTAQPKQLESALARITYGLSLSPEATHGARALYISDPALAKQEMGQVMQHVNQYDLNRDGVLDEHELEVAMEQEAKSRWSTLNSAFATHPPTYKRLQLLRQIDQDIQSRGVLPSNIYAQV